jgi:transposase-like protein
MRPGQLLAELETSSRVAVARKYGVSDKAVRKWIRRYEAAAARSEEKRGEAA